jgi:CDP-glucose 4,6-dehydratase
VQNQSLKEIREQCLSAQRARELLQWAPIFTVDEGLELTIAWYRRKFEEQLARVGRPVNAL